MRRLDEKIASLPAQAATVARHMRRVGWVTSFRCFRDLGVTRLAARIFDIRAAGIKVVCEWIAVTNRDGDVVRYKRYRLGEKT